MLRRLVPSDVETAPDEPWVTNVVETTNKLVDQVTSPVQTTFNLLKQGNVELQSFSVQVPDPWYTVGTAPAPSYENSFAGTTTYAKSYDGLVQVDASVSAGTAATVFHLPVGFRPKANITFVAFDGFTGAATSAQVLADGSFKILGVGAHACSAHVTFMASDVTPIIQSCFPITVKTGLKSVSGVIILHAVDGGNAGSSVQAQNVCVGNPDWTTVNTSKGMQVKINNIMGLAYNRKYTIDVLVIGGDK